MIQKVHNLGNLAKETYTNKIAIITLTRLGNAFKEWLTDGKSLEIPSAVSLALKNVVLCTAIN